LDQTYLIGIASIVVLGVAAQWLAWRVRIPSILLLLLFGVMAGPGTEYLDKKEIMDRFLDPDLLFGEMLLPLVSVFVAVILFEGGLTLSLAELRQAGRVIPSLVTVGALITWVVAALGARYVLGLATPLAVLFGAILVVTGPTVIGPLLRDIRPTGQVGGILRWEGIVIDPIGVLLTVVVFESILTKHVDGLTRAIVVSVLLTIVVGTVIGLVGAAILVLLLKKHWMPDYLQSPVTLAVVVAAFAGCNTIQHESGLFAVTVMGIALANQRFVHVKHILEFKENLTVLLISSLFIMLGARLQMKHLEYIDWRVVGFLAVLVLVARPLAVMASTFRAGVNWREKLFLMFMAPRGVVAASVASVYALRLQSELYQGAEFLVPYMFAVIIGTVTIYGLTAGWAARRLGLANPKKRGFLIVGANRVAREVGAAIQREGLSVLLVDTNRENLQAARLAGLPTFYGSILSQGVMEKIELSSIGRLLALTPNGELNSLAAIQFGRVFGRSEVYQIATSGQVKVEEELHGRVLFGHGVTYEVMETRLELGAVVRKTHLTDSFDYKQFQAKHGGAVVPLFTRDEAGQVSLMTADKTATPKAGQAVVSLMGRSEVGQAAAAAAAAAAPARAATAAGN
jgi:NhaP-type Na+/H+ or K+/H+ antiporter